MRVSNQSTQEVYQKITHTAMTRMLNLRNVLELINNGINNRAFAEQETVRQGHRQTVLRVGFQIGDELDPEGLAKELNKWVRNVAFISKNLAKQLMDQVWNRFTIIHIGWGH